MNEQTAEQITLKCLAENYGLHDCRLRRLPGENLNFLVSSARDGRYVLKIVGDDAPPAVVQMEDSAIEHAISRGFRLKLPEIIENKYGNIETGIKIHSNALYRARLLNFLDGIGLDSITDISKELLNDLGNSLGLFHQAMKNFEHPAARRDHRWNLATAGQHEDKVALFSDRGQRKLLTWAYRGWNAALERMERVPWQFIHGDAHDENWIVDSGRVAGLIDFGDSCRNPAACDLAICLAYLMMRGPDPFPIAAAIIGGYQVARPLSSDELDLVFPLVCARLAVSVCISHERRAIDAGHPNWFTSEKVAWRLLRTLRMTDELTFRSKLRE